MKGIYLTAEGKAEIEAKIVGLEQKKETNKSNRNVLKIIESLKVYKEILSSATILPVEESWEDLPLNFWHKGRVTKYSSGVIIQPKKS